MRFNTIVIWPRPHFVLMLLNDLLQVKVIVLICILILDSLYINILHLLIRLLLVCDWSVTFALGIQNTKQYYQGNNFH